MGFNLTFAGKVVTISIGIGLDDNIFQIIRKIIGQIFPVLEKEKYLQPSSNIDENNNLENNYTTFSEN